MKAVVDTNVIISALIQPASPPGQIINAWRAAQFDLVTSPALLAELANVLARRKIERRTGFTPVRQAALITEITTTSQVVFPAELIEVVTDAADNRVLEAAVAGAADYIVSGDHHLVDLGEYAGISIVTPARLLAILAAP